MHKQVIYQKNTFLNFYRINNNFTFTTNNISMNNLIQTNRMTMRWRVASIQHFSMVTLFSLFFLSSINAQVSVSISKIDPSCNGFTNGSTTATATGGTAPYTYKWSTGASGNTISGIGSGTFGVTATDAGGRTGTASTTLTNPAPLSTSVSFANICTSGNVTATATGGSGSYTYNWGGGLTGATQTLAKGGYNLIVTDSKGCTASKFIFLPGALGISLKIGELRCFGDCDAAIDALPVNGTAPFTYRWNTGSTTQAIVGIPSGTYSVTITDANGCTASATGTVVNPPKIVVTTSINAPSCGGGANGSATASATGGKAPYIFKWSNGQTTATATGLNVGTYSVTVSDANGCGQEAKIDVRSAANFTVVVVKTDATCASTNGSATAIVTGSTGALIYKWNTGATTQTISNIGAGNYIVTVTDASGCSNSAGTTVNAAGNLAITVSKTDAACGIANGTATATVTVGTAPFTYKWSNNATTASIGLLGAGTYLVTVTDANGCTAISSATVIQTSSFDINIDSRNVSCFGGNNGQATAMVMGGSAPYTYSWSNGATTALNINLAAGTYSVTVTDASGCKGIKTINITQPTAISATASSTATSCGNSNGGASVTVSGGTAPYKYLWSNGATSSSITSLAAGNYLVTVTDNNGCTATASASVGSSSSLNVSLTGVNAACGANNGGATASVTNGTAPFTYLWSTGATTSSIAGLGAGTFGVTVTDKNGCKGSNSITNSSSPSVSVSITKTDVKCNKDNNGSATAVVTGGTAPFTYSWSNAATTATISSLTAGTYTLIVIDANGCSATSSVTIIEPTKLTFSLTSTPATCLAIGSASATISGGTAPYTYLWSNGATTSSISNLVGGVYTLTATDKNGCQVSGSVTVSANTSPNLACSVTITRLISAINANDGELKVTATSGAAPYTYLWSNGKTTSVVSFLSPGNYSVTVTDNNGCTTVCSLNLPNSTCDALVDAGRINGDEDFCPGGVLSPILETVQPSGGSGVLEYLWMYSTNTSVFDANTWIILSGETGPNLINIPMLTRTAYFIRCVRRKGCDVYKETNVVTKRIKSFAEIKGPFSACIGQEVTFTATDLGASANYVWYFDNANIYTSTSRSVTVKFTTAGNQRASLEVYNLGCMRATSQTVEVKSCLQGSGIMQSFNLSVINKKNVKLQWATTNEYLPSKYVVERSNDGRQFEEMSDLKSQNKNNNTYQYDDTDPKMGRAFYRIKHLESDGKISYSEIKKSVIYINGSEPVMAYPNPVGNQLFVELLDVENTEGVIEVYNAQGSLVASQKFTKEQARYEISTAALSAGNYILRIRQSSGETKAIKINKF